MRNISNNNKPIPIDIEMHPVVNSLDISSPSGSDSNIDKSIYQFQP